MADLRDRLNEDATLFLDGGVSTELQRRGVPMSEDSWSGAVALEHPDALRALHEDYIRAGADIITSNTYASSRYHLAAAGLEDRVREVNRRAVALAIEARERVEVNRPVWIAGSISVMAPRFDSRLRPKVGDIEAQFREQAEILAEAGADLIVLEMLRDIDYSAAAVDAALTTGLPVCSGFSCTREGEGALVMSAGVGHPLPLRDVLAAVLGRGESLVAIMHSRVDVVAPALAQVFEAHEGPVAAYPNSGEFQPPDWQFVDIVAPATLAEAAAGWVASGASVVGGCCGVGPEHIRVLRERLGSVR